MKTYIKRFITFSLAMIMLLAVPLEAFANNFRYYDIPSEKYNYINSMPVDKPAKFIEEDKDVANEKIKDPAMPKLYTMRVDYLIQRGGDETKINDQPYIATVGENATEEEQAKVNRDIALKEMDGYTKPTEKFNVNYNYIKNRANEEDKKVKRVDDPILKNHYVDSHPYTYLSKQQPIKVKHVFQSLYNKSKYGGLTENSGPIERMQYGETGHNINVSPLSEDQRPGFAPESSILSTRVPENLDNFYIEYRYNREKYNVVYDTAGGTPIPARTLYFGQTIPKVDNPTKVGATFVGWKANQDIEYINEQNIKVTIKAGELIPDKKSEFKEAMPANNLTFTAVWQENATADYTILYYTEKPDHEFKDGENLENIRQKYDFVGARNIENAQTGSQPILKDMLPIGVTFPDLEGQSENIVKNPDLLKKYYTFNAELTKKQNGVDEMAPNGKVEKVQKKVDSTGRTVYEVFYDRTVYTMIFEKAKAGSSFDPEITVKDIETGNTTVYDYKNGTEPYKIRARFGQDLADYWVRDGYMSDEYVENIFKGDKFAYISKGYADGTYSQGWKINLANGAPYRDVPPYRLTKGEFIDQNRTTTSPSRKDDTGHLIPYDDKTISMGIGQSQKNAGKTINFMPHHVEFQLQGLDGKYHFHPEMYYWKSDTGSNTYSFKAPGLKGFKVAGSARKGASKRPESYFKNLNENRPEGEKTPFAFQTELNKEQFTTNGYVFFKYNRNSYKLNLNSDPRTIKADSAYSGKNFNDNSPQQQSVKFEYPLGNLNLPLLTLTDAPQWVKVAEEAGIEYVFKGWALDPSGVNMVQNAIYDKEGNGKLEKDIKAVEEMPDYNMTLYGIWGEKEPTWTLKIDPNDGSLKNLGTNDFKTRTNLKDKKELIKVAEKEKNIQVFDVKHRTKIESILTKPQRKGYDFLGWELVRFDKNGNEDDAYSKLYKVPELYAFGNDVVSDIYLRAIWVENRLVDMTAYHHFFELDENGNYVENKDLLQKQLLVNRRIGSYTSAVAREQGAKWNLMTEEELEGIQSYIDYKATEKEGDSKQNTFFQVMQVDDPLKEEPEGSGKFVKNPDAHNEFHFYYRAFKTRKYKVNYMDERIKDKMEAGTATSEEIEKYRIIPQELVENGNRHYDARNYRSIPGWKLTSDPQQQLFFNLNEKGELLGINNTGKDEITFYYKDIRVIERKDKSAKTPDGYVRVIFQTDPTILDVTKRGGSFGLDSNGNQRHEVVYDVLEGLMSDNVLVPQEKNAGEQEDPNKVYITPDPGKSFIKWDHQPLLNANTVLRKGTEYVFTAYFDWKDIKINGLVRTESFKDSTGWINEFAPKVDELKKAIRWYDPKTKKESDLPEGVTVKITDTAQIYEKVKELGKTDKEELVRIVMINGEVDFGNGSVRTIEIPVKIYKNVYEALTSGDKPKVLADAEKTDGDLSKIPNNQVGQYVKVTVNPTGKPNAKDSKIYYVNPKALVNIPEINLSDSEKAKLGFTNWTADVKEQNEEKEENGVFNFDKRHKFTKDTVISPGFAKDVVPQESDEKPKVPANYVKVIVDKTDKAELGAAEKQQEIFWVNPTKEVKIPVDNPTAITDWSFDKWTTGEQRENRKEIDLTRQNQFTAVETLITARYSYEPKKIEGLNPKDNPIHTPQGKTPSEEEYKKKITPPDGKTIQSVTIVENIDPKDPGEKTAKVIINYTDGSSVGTNENPAEIKVEVHRNVIPSPDGKKPEGALDNYVVVNFVAGAGGTLSGTTIYYVSPEVEVDLTSQANSITKTPAVGYIVNGEKWTNNDNKKLNGTFTDKTTTFTFEFEKSKDIIEKTPQNPNRPEGYVTVIFKTDGNGRLAGDAEEKTYYVNPNAGIKLKVLGENETAGQNELAVPKPIADTNYGFDKWVETLDTTNPITGDKEHVAHFTKGKVTLTYDGNGASGDVPAQQSVNIGETIQLANQGSLTKDNENFVGWKFDGNEKIYKAGERITLTESKTATAQWSTNSHTVRFETKGGSSVPDQFVKHGETIGQVTPPTFGDKVFMGWTLSGNKFDVSTPITQNITLVAVWQDPVQEIGENDTVEEEFIKVKFNQGNSGKLKVGDNQQENFYYKVAKNLNFDQAVAKGMKVPEIVPNNYYKSKEENKGWDKELALNGTNEIFTAQYEPIADVIPIEPEKTPEEVKKEQPEEMVLVEFKLTDETKAYMVETTRFYVIKDKLVDIAPPIVLSKELGYVFNGWKDVNVENGKIHQAFAEDKEIYDGSREDLKLTITIPNPGATMIYIENLIGANGKLEVISNGRSTTYTDSIYRRRRKEYKVFRLDMPLQAGDIIRYWAQDGIRKSIDVIEVIQ